MPSKHPLKGLALMPRVENSIDLNLVMILHLLVAIILVQIVWIQIRPEKASNWTGFILFEWEILTLCWYFWNERRKRFWNIVSNAYLKRNRWYALHVLVEGHRKNKHCRPRSDATERGLWSGSPWFLIKCSIKIWIKNIYIPPCNPWFKNGLV